MNDRTCEVSGCDSPQVARGMCQKHYHRLWKTGTVELRSVPTRSEAFLASIQIADNGCWHWTGFIADSGYGRFRLDGRKMGAHRASHILFAGPVPEGFEVDHTCHNLDLACPGGPTCLHRRCVRIDHLEAVPQSVNIMRGRTTAAVNAAKTHCRRGHPYDEENTYILPKSGGRVCRICQSEANARSYAKRLAARYPAE